MSAIHFCLDVKRSYLSQHPADHRWWREMKRNICFLEKMLGDSGVPTVHVLSGNNVPPLDDGVGPLKYQKTKDLIRRYNLFSDFTLNPDSLVATTNTLAAYTLPIMDYIEDNEYSKIILSGPFEACCGDDLRQGFSLTRTACAFSDAGYDVVIAKEATQRGVMSDGASARSLSMRRRYHRQFGVEVLPAQEALNELDRSFLRQHKAMYEYLLSCSREITVKRLRADEKRAHDKQGKVNRKDFRRGEKPTNRDDYTHHHKIPIYLNGADAFWNYAWVPEGFHHQIHEFIEMQGVLPENKKQKLLIPMMKGTVWDLPRHLEIPQPSLPARPAGALVCQYEGKMNPGLVRPTF